MPQKPNEPLMREEVLPELAKNISVIKQILQSDINEDLIVREFVTLGVKSACVFIEGMAGNDFIDDYILRPAMAQPPVDQLPPEGRAQFLHENVIAINQSKPTNVIGDIADELLNGLSAVFVDGCPEALVLDTRAYDKRQVGPPILESVVVGPQEGFVENLRTNITLMRRYMRSTMLATEMFTVGQKIHTRCALLYLNGVPDEKIINAVRQKIAGIGAKQVRNTGELMQFLEERPLLLFPQILQTERPDRTAAALSAGQVAILMENSPYALILPTTLFDLLHAPDDTYMRWQLGSFIRLIRMTGIFFSLYLPGIYVALTIYHSHMIPMDLLTSIAETRANVPFSVIVEMFIMEFSFFLINEAGTRIPSQIGSALGIVGALILGQAAVSASIISPILIIIVALTGLGNYAIPNYSMSLGVEILRIFILITGAILGLYGIVIASFVMFGQLASVECFGIPYLAPITPWRPHNPDIVLRLPIWLQQRLNFFAKKDSWLHGDDR